MTGYHRRPSLADRLRFAGPDDEVPFRAWLADNKPPAWPLDDMARMVCRGLNGDDDLGVMFAADGLWERFCLEEKEPDHG